jgi:hypothetical protein
MGMINLFSSCSCNPGSKPAGFAYSDRAAQNTNPDPRHFSIEKITKVGKHVVVRVRYPNCQNYEGEKVLLIRNTTEKQVRAATFLDPHFCESSIHLTPFARFEPTEAGWQAAITCAVMLT